MRFGVPLPFQFGLPEFSVAAVVSMCIVALVIMTETTGDMIAISEIVGRPLTPRRLADGLRADGLGTVLGGVLGAILATPLAAVAWGIVQVWDGPDTPARWARRKKSSVAA